MALWIVRHAKPLIAPGICYGALDIAADATATQAAASALATVLPQGLRVEVSPLRRCLQLQAALQALRSDLVFSLEPRLAEMNFGIWEGVAWDAVDPQALSAWTDDFGNHRFGGIESTNSVLERVAQVWELAVRSKTREHVWITHAGVARAAALISQGVRKVSDARQWPKLAPGYGQWVNLAL
jgi:alpha-ribazole phosphatase